MTKTRRKFTAEQKAAIVRRHLKDKEPISSIAEELSIQPTQIHQWVALALEQVERAFEKSAKSEKVSQRAEAKINELKDQRIKKLEEKQFGKYYNQFFAEFFPSIAKEMRERMVEDAAQFDRAELISGRPAPDPLPHPLLEVEKILKERRVERGGRISECFAAIERTDQQTKALEKLVLGPVPTY